MAAGLGLAYTACFRNCTTPAARKEGCTGRDQAVAVELANFKRSRPTTSRELIPMSLLELQGPVCRQACGPTSSSGRHPVAVQCRWSLTVRAQRRGEVHTVSAVTKADQIKLPDSREAAVEQACAAALGNLQASSSVKPRKSFKGSSLRRLALELPVSDESPEEVARLAGEFYSHVPEEFKAELCLICSPEVGRLTAKGLPTLASVSLDARRAPQSARCLLLLGLTQKQIPDAKRLLSNCRADIAVLVSASADKNLKSDVGQASFLKSFETIYCFEPIAIKAYVLTTDGVVYKNGVNAPWFIMKRDLVGKHKSIGRMNSRPQQQDLEAAFLNAAAVDSPVNRGIGALKKLITRQ